MDLGQFLVRMLKVVDVSVQEVITAVEYRSCSRMIEVHSDLVCFYSPGSQPGRVPQSRGSVTHLSPGELGGPKSTEWPHSGVQAAVDRESVRQRTGQLHHLICAAC